VPSHLVPMNEDIFQQWVAKAEAPRQIVRITARAPWQGYCPDLPPDHASPSAFQAIYGLVARPDTGGHGEVLMHDAGFSTVDGANLPLTTDSVPAAPASGFLAITMLAAFNRTTAAGAKTTGSEYEGPTLLALVGGNDSTVGSTELWRLLPSAGTWERVPYCLHANVTAANEASASRAFLSDWAEFPAGAPGRSVITGNDGSGAISEPVFVWCNLQDQVMMYPVPDAVAAPALLIEDGAYEPLTNQFTDDFRAATVEHFGGRLYFGHTVEAGTHHRQRIRRTALFTADPYALRPGAGAFDVRDFAGDLLRLEKLADMMVAYFEDGVAFIRTTDVATAPDRVQLLREKRGLLSTHSVVSVGNQEHFGIFDDGWFFLDPSGRWTEAGVINVEGVQLPKWKETFYRTIDLDKKDRCVVSYDGRYVRIAFTAVGETDNERVWNFDPRGNRVFIDEYPVVCWGEVNAQLRAAVLWDELVPGSEWTPDGTWAGLSTPGLTSWSWEMLGAQFGLKNMHHGTLLGDVLVHDYAQHARWNTLSRALESARWGATSLLTSGGDPTTLKTATKLWVEQVNSGTKNVTMRVGGDSTEGRESQSIYWSLEGVVDDISTTWATFNFTATQLFYQLAGFHPVRIRSVHFDIAVGESRERYSLTGN